MSEVTCHRCRSKIFKIFQNNSKLEVICFKCKNVFLGFNKKDDVINSPHIIPDGET